MVHIAVSSSARNSVVGIGGAIEIYKLVYSSLRDKTLFFSSILGKREEQNPYSRELVAIAHALNILPKLRFRSIMLITRNKVAALILRKPRQ
jgi:hypothetical protein